MFTNEETPFTAEETVEALRAVRARISEMSPLTTSERKTLRDRIRTSAPALQAAINVIGVHEIVEQAVGQPASEVRQLYAEACRWTAVEDELRGMLSGVAGANLLRRERLARAATQATTIGTQLARDPAHAVLIPHLLEVRRLKAVKHRRTTAETPEP